MSSQNDGDVNPAGEQQPDSNNKEGTTTEGEFHEEEIIEEEYSEEEYEEEEVYEEEIVEDGAEGNKIINEGQGVVEGGTTEGKAHEEGVVEDEGKGYEEEVVDDGTEGTYQEEVIEETPIESKTEELAENTTTSVGIADETRGEGKGYEEEVVEDGTEGTYHEEVIEEAPGESKTEELVENTTTSGAIADETTGGEFVDNTTTTGGIDDEITEQSPETLMSAAETTGDVSQGSDFKRSQDPEGLRGSKYESNPDDSSSSSGYSGSGSSSWSSSVSASGSGSTFAWDGLKASADKPTTVAPHVPTDIQTDAEAQRDMPVAPGDGPEPAATSSEKIFIVPSTRKKKVSPIWYWLAFLLMLCLFGAGAYVAWFLVEENRNNLVTSMPDDSLTRPPTLPPTTGFTTVFDPIQGNCDFMGLENPNPIDQCECVGEIQIIPADVRQRYDYLRIAFIPTLYEEYDDEISSCSPRNQVLVWLSSANDYVFDNEERVQRYALATIYAGLGGPFWDMNNNWLDMGDPCNWEGVLCQSGVVYGLALDGNNLVGMIPPEIALLHNLSQFTAARNEIFGPIPASLFSIMPLERVDLSFNQLSGPVPPSLGMAKNLVELNLENNELGGSLSQELGGATKLQDLNLATNKLVGAIPPQFFGMTSLTNLDLGGNMLSGSIPIEIEQLTKIQVMTLGPNSFSGDIQTSISELTDLRYLYMTQMDIGGRLPAAFGLKLTNLIELTISDTLVAGNIETYFGDFPKLNKLDLSRNQIRGSIPSEIGNLGNLTVMDLSGNAIDGTIPDSIGFMPILSDLLLNDNLLSGTIPVALSYLEPIQTLRLDGNLFTGRVIDEICDLRSVNLSRFVVDCPTEVDGVEFGVVCPIPDCCTDCRPYEIIL